MVALAGKSQQVLMIALFTLSNSRSSSSLNIEGFGE